MTSKNDITGDSIKSKTGDQKKYAEGFDRIFKSRPQQHQQNVPTTEELEEIKRQQQDPRHNQF